MTPPEIEQVSPEIEQVPPEIEQVTNCIRKPNTSINLETKDQQRDVSCKTM